MTQKVLPKKDPFRQPVFFRDLKEELKSEYLRSWAASRNNKIIDAIKKGEDVQIGEYYHDEEAEVY